MLATELCGVTLKNPVIAASGTFGFGKEYAEIFDISRLGGISSKGLTLEPRFGNTGERVYETASGLINSIGLQNPGVEAFIKEDLPFMQKSGAAVIVNLGGHDLDSYLKGVELLDSQDFDLLELNISCPNVKAGGMAFGMEPATAGHVVKEVRARCHKPLMVKLSPNAPDLVGVALSCQQAGADCLSLVNTFQGMAIDIYRQKPVFDNVFAGFSGPAILPIALRMVYQVCAAVEIPVVGLGGISSAEDAIAFMMAGARAVQVGTATFARPTAMLDIISGMEDFCQQQKLAHIGDIVGAANPGFRGRR